MPALVIEKKIFDFSTAVAMLAEQIREFDRRAMICKTQDVFIRFEVPVHRYDPLSWLEQQDDRVKFFWADKNGRGATAAIGAADIITGDKKINVQYLYKRISENLSEKQKGLRYYGGCAFDSSHLSDEWKEFGTYYFFIPRFELAADRNRNFLACNIARREFTQDKISQITQQLLSLHVMKREEPAAVFRVESREDFPSKSKWISQIRSQLDSISRKAYQKIVLARKSIFGFKSIVPPLAVMRKLQSLTPGCFHFYFQTAPNKVFLGASPERLFQREGKTLQTEALAGTRPRGATKKEDAALQRALLTSKKELLEHKFVIEDIAQVLQEVCRKIEIDRKNSLLKLESGHHLLTRISAALRDDVDDAAILFVLHPTPAVAGTPTDIALKAIKKIEPFSRGWYAGPIGYFGYDASEFAVAIRSALIADKQVSLYAGAGIVEGSSPENEWQEIENKISTYLRIFTHETF